MLTTIQEYGAKGYDYTKQYGGALASQMYDVSKSALTVAGNEAYNAANYLGNRATHYSKQKVTIKQIVVFAIVAVIVYLIWQETQKGEKSTSSGLMAGVSMPSFGGGAASSNFDNTPNPNKTLSKGTRGVNVRELQTKLGISADGIFGNQTESALFAATGKRSITLAEFNSQSNGSNTNSGNIGSNGNSGNTTVGATSPASLERAALNDLTGAAKIEQTISYAYENSNSYIPANFGRSVSAFMQLSDSELRQANTTFKAQYGKTIYKHYDDMWFWSLATRQRWYPLKTRLTNLGLN